jgi:hypothetical protein
MTDICRRFLSIGLAVLIFIALCGISWADTDDALNATMPEREMGPQCRMMQPHNEGFPMGVPLEALYSGHGFALKGNESHILRLKIETIMPLQPGQIRDLLSSNKSPEEIRDDIQAGEEDEKAFRGSMILDRSIYPLMNIAIGSCDNNSTSIQADLVDIGQQPADSTTSAGRLSVEISPSDGGMIGRGELDIRRGQSDEAYSILLDMEPHRQGQMRDEGGLRP